MKTLMRSFSFTLNPCVCVSSAASGQIFWMEAQDLVQPNPFSLVEEERIVQPHESGSSRICYFPRLAVANP
jgi:hypothetical protein